MRKKKIWINNNIEQKMIDVDQQIPVGWTAGRLQVSSETKQKLSEIKKNKVHVHFGDISKVVFKDELEAYLAKGYELGRAKFSEDAINNIKEARKNFFNKNPNWTNQTSWKTGQTAWNKDLKMPEETRQKLSELRLGMSLSEESRQIKIKHEQETRINNAGSIEESYRQAQEKRLATLAELKENDPEYINKIQEKSKQTCLEKYGYGFVMQCLDIKNKSFETKIKRNNFCSSKKEELFYDLLLTKFSRDDIIRQYKEERYPFHCDFYIKSLDLFIELNLYWTHGFHRLNKNDKKDILRLERIRRNQKLITLRNGKVVKNSYYQAELVWTVSDPLKQKIAQDNNLNYIAIYKECEIYDFIRRI